MNRTSIVLVTAGMVATFCAARFCAAQSRLQAKHSVEDSYVAFHQLEAFVNYLRDTKQTNTLQRFNEYSTVSAASQQSSDLSMTVAILLRLREGRTNQALELLENRLTTDV